MTKETTEFWRRLEKKCGCKTPNSKDGFGNRWCNICYKPYQSKQLNFGF
jgi:hypothetical protein